MGVIGQGTVVHHVVEQGVFGRLVRRYKRFLCDVELADGRIETVYCPNPGRMTTCCEPGFLVRCSDVSKKNGRYSLRLDMVFDGRCWIGVNPSLANAMVAAAIRQGLILPMLSPEHLRKEVTVCDGWRVDFLHQQRAKHTYIEVKSVTDGVDGIGYFPDAVSKRAQRHLQHLTQMVDNGHRAMVVYCVQRSDIQTVRPARTVDPAYAQAFDAAVSAGVDCYMMVVHPNVDGQFLFDGAAWLHRQ